ncbi:WSC domain-containing protein 2-like [Branchiostoma floridae]|uniref:WSC domain-containing protein 2-like n=1 Tax=Branchiostoma floridae TaxID=7739 RepID=A0A9J7M878_BRAFL|nr:WSC domain-containing protein 2-like [Branchiostoma floridae]
MASTSATMRMMFVLLLVIHVVDFRAEAHGWGWHKPGGHNSGEHSGGSHGSGGHSRGSHRHSGGHSHGSHHSGSRHSSHGSHSHGSHSHGHSHSSSQEHGQGGYKGCYVDNRNRVFPHSPTSSNSMTTAICKAHCKRNGYAYAGTEYAQQCFCGTAAQFARLPAPRRASECNKKCKGNKKEICGGTWRISIYWIGGGGGGVTTTRTHYRVYNEAKTYSEAQRRCQQDGGHLADLKTPAIAAVVARLVDT